MVKKEKQEDPKTVEAQKQADLDALANEPIPTRKVRIMMISATEFMFLFLKGMVFRKQTKIVDGAPDDAQIVGVAYEAQRNGIMLVVKSEEYDEIPINILPPVQVVTLSIGVKDATKKKNVKRRK